MGKPSSFNIAFVFSDQRVWAGVFEGVEQF